MDFERRILPFYMTYPAGYGNTVPYGRQDADVLRDLEYFRQMYPAEVRRYQTRVAEILDKMDYEGSVIYDAVCYTPRRAHETRLNRGLRGMGG
ncbi:MAG: hypothetical protein K2L18_03670, partial [Acetatifactor sp.]|nr:hypothetical protein [Acetatifactor sp.]